MATTTMSITRGLSELKLLDSRIGRSIESGKYVIAYKKSAKKVDGIHTPEEFVENAKSSIQSVRDLIERRNKIKSAIVDSNAKTVVEIGDKKMTVAEAIERKSSIEYEKNLLNTLRYQYGTQGVKLNTQNESVNDKLNQLIEVSFGKEGKQKVNQNEIEAISKPYLEQNEWVLLNPLKVDELIEEMSNEIDTFLNEVDFVLSESNTLTKIEIEE